MDYLSKEKNTQEDDLYANENQKFENELKRNNKTEIIINMKNNSNVSEDLTENKNNDWNIYQ